ncbi:MAG: ABC transporter permease [Opitutaceae bacterium]
MKPALEMSAAMADPTGAPIAEAEAGTSLWKDAWNRLRKNRLAVAAGVFILLFALVCTFGPWVISTTYREVDLELGASPPGAEHWLGTDVLGRDMLARILQGGRISLAVGLCATFVSLTIGVAWGAVAGFYGGKLDAVMMRIVDILYALPFTIFVILLMVFSDAFAKKYNLGAGWNLMILFAAIGAVEWLTMARIVRSQIMALRRQEFIEAAFSLGLRKRRIIVRHMIPNAIGPVIVYTTLTIPAVMLLEAFLSFLGLGVQAPMSSLGSLIKEGADKMEEFPWLLVFPGTIFSLTLFSLNFLGDGLRDALDVRASKD